LKLTEKGIYDPGMVVQLQFQLLRRWRSRERREINPREKMKDYLKIK
jgi:hypothetical protein